MPKNKRELLAISGWGEIKIEKYGSDFIEHIKKNLECPITKRPNVDFNLNNAQKTLCDQFAVSTLSGFGLNPIPLAKAAAAAPDASTL